MYRKKVEFQHLGSTLAFDITTIASAAIEVRFEIDSQVVR